MPQENQNIKPPFSPQKLPFWKALLVKALRGTIGVLENTAENLKPNPHPEAKKNQVFYKSFSRFGLVY